MATFNRKVMCAECPFRKKAPAGWLGPYTVTEMEQMAHSEANLICHVSVKKMADDGATEDEIEDNGQHCVGILRYRNGVCKKSRDPQILAVQNELQTIKDQAVIAPGQFRKYHESNSFLQKD